LPDHWSIPLLQLTESRTATLPTLGCWSALSCWAWISTTRAIASKRLSGDALGSLKRARLNERQHYNKVSEILSGAGQTPAVASDFDFSYPKGAFASKSSIAKLGVRLEAAFMGAYLGAVEGLQTNALKQPVAQVAANEAEHLSVFMRLSGRSPIGIALPRPLTIDEASNALDVFTS
jgi:hypothetical protein